MKLFFKNQTVLYIARPNANFNQATSPNLTPIDKGHENIRIMIIEQVEIGNPDMLSTREIYWQNQLRCFMENGGQAHCKRKEK